jgi:hypothetical protein
MIPLLVSCAPAPDSTSDRTDVRERRGGEVTWNGNIRYRPRLCGNARLMVQLRS